MKTFAALLLILTTASFASDSTTETQAPVAHDLMKCFSANNGTLWTSFGHMIRSGETTMQHFPTEIVLFSKTLNARTVYTDFNEALKVDLEVRDHSLHFAFDMTDGTIKQSILIQLIEMDTRTPNSYAGNWKTVSSNGSEINDAVYCTLH